MLKSIKVVSIGHFWGEIIKLADFWKIVFFNFTLNLGATSLSTLLSQC